MYSGAEDKGPSCLRLRQYLSVAPLRIMTKELLQTTNMKASVQNTSSESGTLEWTDDRDAV